MPTRRLKNTTQNKRSASTLSLRTVEGKILDALREAISEAFSEHSQASLFAADNQHCQKARIVVGFSGGRDSVALLKSLCVLRAKRNSPIAEILAVHVHHALSPNANKWARF